MAPKASSPGTRVLRPRSAWFSIAKPCLYAKLWLEFVASAIRDTLWWIVNASLLLRQSGNQRRASGHLWFDVRRLVFGRPCLLCTNCVWDCCCFMVLRNGFAAAFYVSLISCCSSCTLAYLSACSKFPLYGVQAIFLDVKSNLVVRCNPPSRSCLRAACALLSAAAFSPWLRSAKSRREGEHQRALSNCLMNTGTGASRASKLQRAALFSRTTLLDTRFSTPFIDCKDNKKSLDSDACLHCGRKDNTLFTLMVWRPSATTLPPYKSNRRGLNLITS